MIKFYNNLDKSCITIINAINNKEDIKLNDKRKTINSALSTFNSFKTFLKELDNIRCLYPDVIEPLLCNLVHVTYGIKLKISLLKKLLGIYENLRVNMNLQEFMVNLIKFPNMDFNQNSFITSVNSYMNVKVQKFIGDCLENENNPYLSKQENFRFVTKYTKYIIFVLKTFSGS